MFAMENRNSFLELFSLNLFPSSWFSSSKVNESNKKINESPLIVDLRKNKDEFENKLKLLPSIEYRKKSDPSIYKLFITTTTDPLKFLQYCYYQKFHETEPYMSLTGIKNVALCNNTCQSANINGYSALGAAMVAKDVSPLAQRNFIQELINLGFKPTLKDKELANFIAYESIMEEPPFKLALIYLLHLDSAAYWCIDQLPKEIKKLIASYLIKAIKKDVFPLLEY